MPSARFGPKDPAAVERGRKSAKNKDAKAHQKPETPTKKEAKLPPPIHLAVSPISTANNGKLVLIENGSGKTTCYERPNATGSKRKLLSADEFFLEATGVRKKLKESIFNSSLSEVELRALDLQANVKIFPELVNRDADLRLRPLDREAGVEYGRPIKRGKIAGSETGEMSLEALATPSGSTPLEILERLREKGKWFKDIEIAAQKQAVAYTKAANQVADSITGQCSPGTTKDRIMIPTSGLEAALSEDIPKLHHTTRDDWRTRETALLSHVHALAENYRQELSALAVYLKRAVKTLDEVNISAGILLSHLNQKNVSEIDLEAWAISQASAGSHRCQCEVCKGLPVSYETANIPSSELGHVNQKKETESADPTDLLRDEFEKTKEEISNARTFLKEEQRWSISIPVETMPKDETRAEKQEPLVHKWQQWISARIQAIEASHETFLKEAREKKARIEWEMDARKEELDVHKSELNRLESYKSPEKVEIIAQLNDTIIRTRLKVLGDQKVRDADLDVEEFLEVCSLPNCEWDDWLRRRGERIESHQPGNTTLREARGALQSLLQSYSVDWKLPEELQTLYKQLPTATVQEIDRMHPLFKNRGTPASFDFSSAELWATQVRRQRGGGNNFKVEERAPNNPLRKVNVKVEEQASKNPLQDVQIKMERRLVALN